MILKEFNELMVVIGSTKKKNLFRSHALPTFIIVTRDPRALNYVRIYIGIDIGKLCIDELAERERKA